MSDRYALLIAAQQSHAHFVLVLFIAALSILAARWALQFIPAKYRTFAITVFDLYIIGLNTFLFFITN